jgi:hypothetical protein
MAITIQRRATSSKTVLVNLNISRKEKTRKLSMTLDARINRVEWKKSAATSERAV